jgi:hypothetical protein
LSLHGHACLMPTTAAVVGIFISLIRRIEAISCLEHSI